METLDEIRSRAGLGRIWIAGQNFERALRYLGGRAIAYSTADHWILLSGITKELMRELAANRIDAHLTGGAASADY